MLNYFALDTEIGEINVLKITELVVGGAWI